jgi:hypothetical protein
MNKDSEDWIGREQLEEVLEFLYLKPKDQD